MQRDGLRNGVEGGIRKRETLDPKATWKVTCCSPFAFAWLLAHVLMIWAADQCCTWRLGLLPDLASTDCARRYHGGRIVFAINRALGHQLRLSQRQAG